MISAKRARLEARDFVWNLEWNLENEGRARETAAVTSVLIPLGTLVFPSYSPRPRRACDSPYATAAVTTIQNEGYR